MDLKQEVFFDVRRYGERRKGRKEEGSRNKMKKDVRDRCRDREKYKKKDRQKQKNKLKKKDSNV